MARRNPLLLPSAFKDFRRVRQLAIFDVFWRESGYFAGGGFEPLLHTWSLSVEEQFFLLFPLLLLTCCGRDQRPGMASRVGIVGRRLSSR
jgi:peptidoglycan/LPS O-acetylase OafA/YrhL